MHLCLTHKNEIIIVKKVPLVHDPAVLPRMQDLRHTCMFEKMWISGCICVFILNQTLGESRQ